METTGIIGVCFWGPYSRHYSTLGSILGSPYLGKIPAKIDETWAPLHSMLTIKFC